MVRYIVPIRHFVILHAVNKTLSKFQRTSARYPETMLQQRQLLHQEQEVTESALALTVSKY